MPIRNRYPGADSLAQRGHWDEATRRVILDRVHNVPEYTHFTPDQQAVLAALCDRVLPQTHRPTERRVPIAPWIDRHCAEPVLAGFRFDDMPANAVAWDLGLRGLDETARARFGAGFAALPPERQDAVLELVRAGDPPGEAWQRLPARRWWVYVALRQITGVYYAHPSAWDEIGFGGPAYPRGYTALNHGAPEPWEAPEAPDRAGRR